jgi:hypothetical protein
MQNKGNIRISKLSVLLTCLLWFFYPISFALVCNNQDTWYFFLTFHIAYCVVLLIQEYRLTANIIYRANLGPHIVNVQGQILFPGIEVYENHVVDGKMKQRYGLLQHDYGINGEYWTVRWENQPFSDIVENPQYLRYEPIDKETKYFDIVPPPSDLGTAVPTSPTNPNEIPDGLR